MPQEAAFFYPFGEISGLERPRLLGSHRAGTPKLSQPGILQWFTWISRCAPGSSMKAGRGTRGLGVAMCTSCGAEPS